jgi:Tfp pilus assembly protein PilV
MHRTTGHHRSPARSRGDGLGTARVTRRALKVDHRGSDDGVTLVEVLVAGVVLLLVMIPMGIFLANATSAASQSRQREAAVQLADSWIEILANSQPPTRSDGAVATDHSATPTAPPGTQAPPSTLAGTTYLVKAVYTIAAIDQLSGSDLCSSGEPPSPSHPDVIELQVTVSWNNLKQSVTSSTEINYPKPGLQTDGFLAINLSNDGLSDINLQSAATRLMAIPVTITQTSASGPVALSPASFTVTADENGCIFVQVPPGSYEVDVTQPPPGSFAGYSGVPAFVTPSGDTSETQQGQTVNVTAETSVQLDYFDEGIIGNITYGGSAAVDGGVQCPGGALTCVTTGSRTSSASTAWGGAGAAWTVARISGASRIKQVACTASGSSTCVGVGTSSSGAVSFSTTTNFSSAAPDDGLATVTDLSQVTCPTSDGCYALGTTSTGPALLAGSVASGVVHWAVVTPAAIPFSTMNSIACPTSGTCELTYTTTSNAPGVLRLDGDPSARNPTVWVDTLPPTVTAIGTVTCPLSGDCEALAVGDLASPLDATVLTGPIAASGATTWTGESTFPTGASTVTGLSCTPTTCLAIGSLPGSGPTSVAVWTGDLTPATHGWVQANTFPSTLASVTSVACGHPATGDTADCLVAGTTGTSGTGLLVDGSLTGGSWAWNSVSPPSGVAVQFYDDVACQSLPTSTGSACAAVGATLTGPVVLASSSGPAGTWTNVTPSSFPGAKVSGIPIETAPAGTSSWTPQLAAGHGSVSVLPKALYPQAGGYSVVAGDCNLEGKDVPTGSLVAVPGGTGTATVPLGLLALQLVNNSGAPVSGATLTLTSTTCGTAYADAYTMPVTDGYGLSVTSVPYGSYSYTVTVNGTSAAHTAVNLTVGPSAVTESVNGVTTTTYLPNSVQVAA